MSVMSEHVPPPIYVVFVLTKSERKLRRLNKVVRMLVEAKDSHFFSSTDSSVLDVEIKKGLTVETLLQLINHRSLDSVQKILIVGSGSSAFAREVIRSAVYMSPSIPIHHWPTMSKACMWRYHSMLHQGWGRVAGGRTFHKLLCN